MRGQLRRCATCHEKPRAQQGQVHCYDCAPGGPFAPPACSSCRSVMDHYAAGLCARCHPIGPRSVDSCRCCHAWGATRHHAWVCWACRSWNIKYPLGMCDSCRGVGAVNHRGVCRLCWRNASGNRSGLNHTVDPIGANRNGQQLFFADMHKAAAGKGPSTAVRPVPPVPAPVAHRQLLLFVMPHDLSRGYSVVREPPIPDLAAGLEALTRVHTRRHGWHYNYAYKVRAGLNVLLGLQDTPGAPITRSETAVLNRCNLPERAVCQILAEAGMLVDDRTPTIERWFEREVAELPAPMVAELRVWLDVMGHGSTTSPRRRPRSETTIRIYLSAAQPAVVRWASDGHRSLREISRDDLTTVLPASGVDRSLIVRSFRSIFAVLKGRKLVFTNPASRVRALDGTRGAPLPLDPAVINRALHSPDPARAAVTALIAFHGLRSGQLRSLQMTDLRDRRLHLNDRVVLLANPVIERLNTYLDYRRTRWPAATNPHLFINFRSAIRTGPVGNRWLWLTVDLPGGSQALREDRILHEAQATGGDVRRLTDLFGISVAAATRYTNTVDHPDLTMSASTHG
jgi:hypothetical protein